MKQKFKKRDLNKVTILAYGPNEFTNHCHLWKNARDGGSLVSHQVLMNEKSKSIKSS
jgi:hypothetical protein